MINLSNGQHIHINKHNNRKEKRLQVMRQRKLPSTCKEHGDPQQLKGIGITVLLAVGSSEE